MANFNFIQLRTETPVGTEVNFDFGSNAEINILAGNSNIITAIWAEPGAGRSTGKMHVTSYGTGAAFSVLDLATKILYDRYTISVKGRADETLVQEDTEDLVVGS